MIELIALLLKLGGVAFLGIATIGLIRFDDPFQRMHAATKAGTLGAGLVLIGTMMSKGTMDAAMTGSFALLFLILTIPVASHLLARAAYVSGAELAGIGDADALAGRLTRLAEPIEDRLDRLAFQAPHTAPVPTGLGRAVTLEELIRDPIPAPAPELPITPERLRFAALGTDAPRFARRAAGLAAEAGLPATAVIALDLRLAGVTGDSQETLRRCRNAVGAWMPELRAIADDLAVPLDLVYEEGDAEDLITGAGECRELLVLPTEGWVDHGLALTTPHQTREPDGLLRLSDRHPGPVLYATAELPSGPIVVVDDGSDAVRRAIALALDSRLWPAEEMHIVGVTDPVSRTAIDAQAAAAGITTRYTALDITRSERPLLSEALIGDAAAVIVPDLPRPLRVYWYGAFWQDRIATGWRGDVLVWT